MVSPSRACLRHRPVRWPSGAFILTLPTRCSFAVTRRRSFASLETYSNAWRVRCGERAENRGLGTMRVTSFALVHTATRSDPASPDPPVAETVSPNRPLPGAGLPALYPAAPARDHDPRFWPAGTHPSLW